MAASGRPALAAADLPTDRSGVAAGRRWAGALLLAVLVAVAPAAAAEPAVELLRFQGVRWQGLGEAELANVRQRVSLARLKVGTGIRPERFDYLSRRLTDEVRAALEPFGYYQPSIDLQPRRQGRQVALEVRVDAGAPVRIRQRRVEIAGAGGADPVLGERLAAFAPALGEPLRHDRYQASKLEIERALAERGYFDAELVEARVEVSRALAAADIDLRWNSGPRYRFGAVEFSAHQLRPGLLDPLLPFRPEQPFAHDGLLQLQQRLTELDYFGRIDLQPRPPRPDDHADGKAIGIEVELAAAARNLYRTGASYGTDTGVALELGYDRRWLNASGHKFSGAALLGEQRSALRLLYRIPAFERWPGWWSASVSLRDEPFADLPTDSVEAALQREASWRGNRAVLGLHLLHERFNGEGERLVYPQLSLGRSQSDDPLYPRHGFSWNLLARWSLPALGAEVGFRQWQADLGLVRALGERDTLLARLTLGAIHTGSGSIERIPPSFRFYAGGDRSVRGYGYQELGPRSEADQRIGGRRLLTASLEWERRFTSQWGGALFVDAGNAFSGDFSPALGAGIGLRWRSPVGPVRIDLGHGFDQPEQSLRLHVQLGPVL